MIAVWFVVVSLLVQTPTGSAKPAPAPELVAIVSALDGKMWAQGKPMRRLALYDWLHVGTVIDLDAQAQAVLVMMDGRRYELGGGSRVELTATSATTLRGPVKEAAPVPQLASLAPIAGRAPKLSGAVRLRAATIPKLNPCYTVVTLRDATVLRFEPIAGASQYAIEVQSEDGQRVFAQTIERPPLAVPSGILSAGTNYIWTVRVTGDGPPARSEGRFHTLDAEAEAARISLASALDAAGSGLLGGIDMNLGLLNEAIAELTAAAERPPDNAAVRAAADRARAALAEACK
jgi:hypothetical protein